MTESFAVLPQNRACDDLWRVDGVLQYFFLYIFVFLFLCERNIKKRQTRHNPSHSGRGMLYILGGVSHEGARGDRREQAPALQFSGVCHKWGWSSGGGMSVTYTFIALNSCACQQLWIMHYELWIEKPTVLKRTKLPCMSTIMNYALWIMNWKACRSETHETSVHVNNYELCIMNYELKSMPFGNAQNFRACQ